MSTPLLVSPKRCAVYCRVSSDERLDQSFNSLDAQKTSNFSATLIMGVDHTSSYSSSLVTTSVPLITDIDGDEGNGTCLGGALVAVVDDEPSRVSP